MCVSESAELSQEAAPCKGERVWAGDGARPATPRRSAHCSEEGEEEHEEARSPDGHADLLRLLADGRDAAVAPAGLPAVTGGRPHVAELAQLRQLDGAVAVSDDHVAVSCGEKRRRGEPTRPAPTEP